MEKLAIVGSGISGLGCAHFLQRHYDLTLYEAAGHIGGHSNTITVSENGREVPIDTGFMVYNEVTYPHLTRLFAALAVPTKPASMSFSVRHGKSGMEWNGGGFNTLFGQRRNLLNVRHWRFLVQLDRFNREAVPALEEEKWKRLSLGEYVEARGYGRDFLERYLIPMSSAVWSTPPEKMLDFPAVTLLRFWHNHGFLGLDTQHPWRTVAGGSQEYVRRMVAPFRDRILLETPVRRIVRGPDGVTVSADGHPDAVFDKVILATHADAALGMLADPSGPERELLEKFRFQPNKVSLHTDPRFMPRTRRCWASWNYRTDADLRGGGERATTHYWMNSLQGVSERKNYFVSLNSDEAIPESACLKKLDYDHPLFDLAAIDAQERLPELNTIQNRTFFCGAWFRYGFHEDGLRSAVDLCAALLGGDPWNRH